MRHSLQQRATRQRRSDRKFSEAAEARDEGPVASDRLAQEVPDSEVPATPSSAATCETAGELPTPWSPPAALRALEMVAVVERFADASSVTPAGEGSLVVKSKASPPCGGALRPQTSTEADILAALDTLMHGNAPGMVPVGPGGADDLLVRPPAAAAAFTGVASMEVLSVVTEGFDLDAALAAVEASLAATTDVASAPVAAVPSAAVSPAFTAMDYDRMSPQQVGGADYFAAARPAFGDAVIATAGAMWNDWGFAEAPDPLGPVLALPNIN